MMPQTSFGQPQQQMPMNTSFNQGMSTTAVNAPTGPLQPQQTGFYSQQQPLEPLKPTATGFINSFANTGVDNTLKIPAIRLSFITTQDQAKFEKLFRSVVTPGSNTITGDQCRNILVKSGLQPHQLAKIWTLSDTNKAGVLLFPEFALAMYLVNSVLQGDSIPYELDSRTKVEVSSFVDAINFSVSNDSEVEQKPKTPFDDLTAGISMMQPQPTGYMPQLSFGSQPQQMQQQQQQQQQQQPQQQSFQGLTQQPTGGYGAAPQTSFGNTSQALQPQSTGFMPQNSFNQPLNAQTTGGFSSVLNIPPPGSMPQTSFTQQAPMQTSLATGGGFLQPQATGYLPPSNFQATAPLQAQKTGFGNNDLYTSANLASKFIARKEEAITPEEKSLFYKIFETYDVEKTGNLDSATAVEIFRKSGLNRSDLEHIWNLCDTNNSGNLNKQEFALGMHLVYRRLNGEVLPNTLPPSLIPSSTKILNTVKDQLKQGVDKNNRQPTKEDGLRFRNNDDELLPSSRNRRKTIDQSKKINENKEKIENLKNLIREKKELLASEKLRLENDSQRKQSENADLLRSIENLKSQIQALPSTSKKSPSANNAVPHDLQSRFDTLTARIPNLFKEISDVNKELVSSQLALHHLKVDHPIRGSGPNCKITELDCKNARQRLTLTAGMCTLVGRPEPNYDNLEAQAQHFNEGIETIEKDDQKKQSAINNISTWIQEISSSVQAIIHGRTPSMGLEMDKWESGIGLEPEVRDFIISWKNRRNFDNSSYNTAGYSDGIQISSSATYRNNARAPEEKDSYSSFQTPEERSAYVKEQAKKKMEEKLAALGIKKKSGSSQSSPNPPQLTQQQQPQQQQQQQQQQPSYYQQPSQPAAAVNNSNLPKANDDDDEDEEDEEERRLLEQLEKLKLKKKQEKEARLAAKRQTSSSPAETKNDNGHDSWDDEPTPTNPTGNQSQAGSHHQYNPFGKSEATQQKPASGAGTPQLNNTPTGGRNPYFKQAPSQTSSFDLKAAEQQRRVQRGLDDSDGWSDDDETEKVNTTANKAVDVSSTAVPATSTAPVPVAPSLPQISATTQEQSSVAVPIAPPLPSVKSESSLIPPPPPLPTSITEGSGAPPVPIAPPLPQINSDVAPAVPVAAPLLKVGGTATLAENEEPKPDDASDVLSIPESVASDEEDKFHTPGAEDVSVAPTGAIPPAPPAPPAPPVPVIPPPPPMP